MYPFLLVPLNTLFILISNVATSPPPSLSSEGLIRTQRRKSALCPVILLCVLVLERCLDPFKDAFCVTQSFGWVYVNGMLGGNRLSDVLVAFRSSPVIATGVLTGNWFIVVFRDISRHGRLYREAHSQGNSNLIFN